MDIYTLIGCMYTDLYMYVYIKTLFEYVNNVKFVQAVIYICEAKMLYEKL